MLDLGSLRFRDRLLHFTSLDFICYGFPMSSFDFPFVGDSMERWDKERQDMANISRGECSILLSAGLKDVILTPTVVVKE